MVGIAREVSALTGAEVRLPSVQEQDIASNSSLAIDVRDPAACMAYIGTVIEGVKVAPSPDWLKWRLRSSRNTPN